jgi:hypothetical protein
VSASILAENVGAGCSVLSLAFRMTGCAAAETASDNSIAAKNDGWRMELLVIG